MIATMTVLQCAGLVLAIAMLLTLVAGGLLAAWGFCHAEEQPDDETGPDGTRNNGTRSKED